VQIAGPSGKKIKKRRALTSYFPAPPTPPPPPPRPPTFIQLKFQLYYTSWPLLYFMGHWGISKHFSPVHNVLGGGTGAAAAAAAATAAAGYDALLYQYRARGAYGK